MFSPNSVAVASVVAVGLSTFAYFISRRNRCRLYRQSEITPQAERVLVIGGTSGVGRAVAELYAQRGARVCIVGRRGDLVQEFVLGHNLDRWGKNSEVIGGRRMGVWADFSQQTDMCCVRTVLESSPYLPPSRFLPI
jgi:NADPH:quinone reductase-like Zn-dependent oxidoreductase